MPTGDPQLPLQALGAFGANVLGGALGMLGGVAQGVPSVNQQSQWQASGYFPPPPPLPSPAVLAGGAVAEGPADTEELPILADAHYQPLRLRDLVRNLPFDIIEGTTRVLSGEIVEVYRGKPIEPLPVELLWTQQMSLHTDKLYTMIKQVVQMELERFAQRIELYYELVPRVPSA